MSENTENIEVLNKNYLEACQLIEAAKDMREMHIADVRYWEKSILELTEFKFNISEIGDWIFSGQRYDGSLDDRS